MEIPLWAGGRWHGNIVAHALVDALDHEALAQHRWSLSTEGYALRTAPRPSRQTISMARQLLGLEYGDPRTADHVNRNKLDNRRNNLRILTPAEQAQNRVHNVHSTGVALTSVYRGVGRARSGRWTATCRGKWLGTFDTEEEAADVARQARLSTMPHAID